jgi:hypothetical protein
VRRNALQQEAIDLVPRQTPQFIGQHRRLVEASPPKPRGIERDGDDEIGIGEKLRTGLGEPPGEQEKALLPIPVFEALDKLAHGIRIARGSPSRS